MPWPWEQKLKTRGRRREARRWMAEQRRRHLAAVFPHGLQRAATYGFARTFAERGPKADAEAERRSAALQARDPALYATVTELMWEDIDRELALTAEQRHAQRMRRVEKLRREHRRAERLKRVRRHRTKKK